MKLFKIRTVADLTKNYIITSSKLKTVHFSIIALTICTTFAIIANIRAPVFLQILLFLLGGFLIYKIDFKLKSFRYNLDFYLILRESLLYVLHTNRLYTTSKDSSGYEKIVRSAVLDRETNKPVALRLNVSIQDENSDFFMEMIQVKVNTLSPTASVQEMTNNKTCPVSLKDLNVGQFNGNLWFACSDVLPVTK